MRRLSVPAAMVSASLLLGCGDRLFMRVGTDPLSSLGIPAFQQVDDSIHLYASEWKHQLIGNPEPAVSTSDEAPESYVWSTSNPAIAEVRPSGWMITHAAGHVLITVRGTGSAYSQSVSVCSRETMLRIEPRDPIIKLHDTITVTVALAPDCGEIEFGAFAPQRGGMVGLEPIFSLPNHWRAVQPGTYWYTSSFYFAQRTLRDSILVTIR